MREGSAWQRAGRGAARREAFGTEPTGRFAVLYGSAGRKIPATPARGGGELRMGHLHSFLCSAPTGTSLRPRACAVDTSHRVEMCDRLARASRQKRKTKEIGHIAEALPRPCGMRKRRMRAASGDTRL
ncbi:hypothetical protein B5F40_01850 [Gordonibacter sp. An230]|nr:hypothetical protein B5F40_01850 [Gordonibacter sp. An230]